ncbi:nuclear envelope integral membrane protein 2 [Ascaphus truei]|uniref:nuclear envelope integral membrane protein 2 n=1 Tax=Ascaphus truei TaxID=8439 RepID=UPI003F598B88
MQVAGCYVASIIPLYVRLWLLLLNLSPIHGQELLDNRCIPVNEASLINRTQGHCFCYIPESNIKWLQLWSTVHVQINSTAVLTVIQQSNALNCNYPENILVYGTCLLQSIWKPIYSNETYINVNQFGERDCFNVKTTNTSAVYTVGVKKTKFSRSLFVLFFGGVFLFYFAKDISRNGAVYYSAGITLGIFASLVFFLLIVKRFIPKHSTFWLLMSSCCFFTAYAIQFLKENIEWLWNENKHLILGYVLTAGLLSFAVCYRHGPLTSQQSINLLTWALQLIACFLIYFGLAAPEVAYAVIAVLISSKGLHYPFRALCYVCRKMKEVFKSKTPLVKLLTEEEYQEQADTETTTALDDLRTFCKSPDLNSWLTVSRLSSPKRFADFMLGCNHVSPEEVNVYEEQYGFGSLFLEEQLFVQERGDEQNQQVDLAHEENGDVEEYQDNYHQNNAIEHQLVSD